MKKIIAISALICAFSFFGFSSESAASAFLEGCKFYSQGDWNSAKIMLKKAVSYPENINADAYFMLIFSQINSGDNKGALDDCNFFLENFPNSLYFSRISYQKGKILYSLGEYEKAVIALSDFCHQNKNDEFYPYALFYIGESLYEGFRYNDALEIYDRIITEFPQFEKESAVRFRKDSILQRSREEKLLYLLKQTGEEYLAAKEDYEKQLKQNNSEAITLTRQKLQESQSRNEDLERQIEILNAEIESLKENDNREENFTPPDFDFEIQQARLRNEDLERQIEILNAEIESLKENDNREENFASQDFDFEIQQARLRNEDLERQIEILKAEIEDLKNKNIYYEIMTAEDFEKRESEISHREADVPSQIPFDETSDLLKKLKQKALEAQRIIEVEK